MILSLTLLLNYLLRYLASGIFTSSQEADCYYLLCYELDCLHPMYKTSYCYLTIKSLMSSCLFVTVRTIIFTGCRMNNVVSVGSVFMTNSNFGMIHAILQCC